MRARVRAEYCLLSTSESVADRGVGKVVVAVAVVVVVVVVDAVVVVQVNPDVVVNRVPKMEMKTFLWHKLHFKGLSLTAVVYVALCNFYCSNLLFKVAF